MKKVLAVSFLGLGLLAPLTVIAAPQIIRRSSMSGTTARKMLGIAS